MCITQKMIHSSCVFVPAKGIPYARTQWTSTGCCGTNKKNECLTPNFVLFFLHPRTKCLLNDNE